MSDSNQKGFFDQLRQLSNLIMTNITTLRSRVEAPPQTDYTSSAVLKLQDMKKELKSLKKESEDILDKCQKKTGDFDCFLSACQSVLESHGSVIDGIEDFLKQYGYKTWDEVKLQKGEEQKSAKQNASRGSSPNADQASADGGEDVHTPESKPCRNQKRTPTLEDFGLGDCTLRYLGLGQQKKVEAAANSNWCLTKDNQQTPLRNNLTQMKQQNMDVTTSDKTGAIFREPVKTPMSTKRFETKQTGTPKMEDFGLSDNTMQLMKLFENGIDIHHQASDVPLPFHQVSVHTPEQQPPIPAKFVNDGVIVTPSIGNGQSFDTYTPAYHIGGAPGFQVEESPYTSVARPQLQHQRAFMARLPRTGKPINMKLEEYLYADETESLPQTSFRKEERDFSLASGMPAKPVLLSSVYRQTDKATPPEPQLVTSLVQKHPTVVDNLSPLEPELLTDRINHLQTASNRTNLLQTKLEPNATLSRLAKQKEACAQISLASQQTYTDKTLTGLHKPLNKRAYGLSSAPSAPKLLYNYNFMKDQNIPP